MNSNYNSGDYNSGYRNSGSWNSGYRNSGSWNSGDYNSGDCNSGSWNSGYRNSGSWNSGYRNSGSWNSGNYNSGYRNSGDYNSGNCNSGYFCTGTPRPTFFDAPVEIGWDEAKQLVPSIELPVGCIWIGESEMTDEEKKANPNYATIGGYLKVVEKDFRVAFSQAWKTLDEEIKQRILHLPNFDAQKFFEITGVDVRQAPGGRESVPSEVTVGGHRYVLAE